MKNIKVFTIISLAIGVITLAYLIYSQTKQGKNIKNLNKKDCNCKGNTQKMKIQSAGDYEDENIEDVEIIEDEELEQIIEE